jgi:hypothetical protein
VAEGGATVAVRAGAGAGAFFLAGGLAEAGLVAGAGDLAVLDVVFFDAVIGVVGV